MLNIIQPNSSGKLKPIQLRNVKPPSARNTIDRPLSSNKQLLKKRYDERIDLYKKYADVIINNDNSLDEFVLKFKNEQNY